MTTGWLPGRKTLRSRVVEYFSKSYTTFKYSIGLRLNRKTRSLESKITEAIIKKGKEKTRKIPKNLNVIALQFSKIDAVLKLIKEEFESLDVDKSHTLDTEEIKLCLKNLHIIISDEDMLTVFKETDMDSNGTLELKEFILFLVLLYLLDTIPATTDIGNGHLENPDVAKAFEMMVNAFLFFDSDLDGILVRSEVASRFGQTGHFQVGSNPKSLGIANSRFSEMDYDKDGTCTFKEFLFAFVGWVGTADEEDDEGDEEA